MKTCLKKILSHLLSIIFLCQTIGWADRVPSNDKLAPVSRWNAYLASSKRPTTFSQNDVDACERSLSEVKYKRVEGEQNYGATLIIQSNRMTDRQLSCSGKLRCWYCYRSEKATTKRLRESEPMNLSDITEIVKRAVEDGFGTIQINGDDTLYDVPSLNAIAEACRDNPCVDFVFFTNGFELLRMADKGKHVFEELSSILGRQSRVKINFSWDPEKVSRLTSDMCNFPEFFGNKEKVFEAMADVMHNFTECFGDTYSTLGNERSVVVLAHDVMDLSNPERAYNSFYQELSGVLTRRHGFASRYSYPRYGQYRFDLTTPEAVERGKSRGYRREMTVTKMYKKMLAKAKRSSISWGGLCNPTVFLDVSTMDLAICHARSEYPRKTVSPENFSQTIHELKSNPRSRHLFEGSEKQRYQALTKQVGFALTLKPQLSKEKVASFQHLEHLMFLDKELMLKIELLFLLEDVLTSILCEPEDFFKVEFIPEQLRGMLQQKDLIETLLRYYSSCEIEDVPARIRDYVGTYKSQKETAVHNLISLLSGNPLFASFSKGSANKGNAPFSRSMFENTMSDLMSERLGNGRSLSMAVLQAGDGRFMDKVAAGLTESGFSVDAVGTELYGSLANQHAKVLHCNAADDWDVKDAREKGQLLKGSKDLVIVDNIESQPELVLGTGLSLLKPNGVMLVTFAESDIATDYRSLPNVLISLADKLGYDAQLVDMPKDFFPSPNSRFGITVQRYSKKMLKIVPKQEDITRREIESAPIYQRVSSTLRSEHRKPRVLLVNAPIDDSMNFAPPTGLYYIKAAVEHYADSEVEIIDLGFGTTDKQAIQERLRAKIAEFAPDVVGISFTSPAENNAYAIAAIVKEMRPNAITVAGGAHASAEPADDILKNGHFDCKIIGEGEMALSALINAVVKSGEREDLMSAKGCHFKYDGEVYDAGPAENVDNLDSLPMAVIPKEDLEKYNLWIVEPARKAVPIITTRGCPYQCMFCSHGIFGYKVRYRSAESIVAELEYYKAMGYTNFLFNDDGFGVSPKRVEELCDLIIKRGLNISFRCSSIRVDQVSLKLLSKMKKAGCVGISFGIESGSDRILKEVIGKGNKISVASNLRATRLAQRAGIEEVRFYLIAGLPGETRDDVQMTVDFVRNACPTNVGLSVGAPRLGSRWTETPEQFDNTRILSVAAFSHKKDADTGRYTSNGLSVSFETDHLTPQDIAGLYRMARSALEEDFFFNPDLSRRRYLSTRIRNCLEMMSSVVLSDSTGLQEIRGLLLEEKELERQKRYYDFLQRIGRRYNKYIERVSQNYKKWREMDRMYYSDELNLSNDNSIANYVGTLADRVLISLLIADILSAEGVDVSDEMLDAIIENNEAKIADSDILKYIDLLSRIVTLKYLVKLYEEEDAGSQEKSNMQQLLQCISRIDGELNNCRKRLSEHYPRLGAVFNFLQNTESEPPVSCAQKDGEIVITGASGDIGTALANRIDSQRCKIVFRSKESIGKFAVRGGKNANNSVISDVVDPQVMRPLISGAKTFYHLSGIVRGNNPIDLIAENSLSSIALIKWAEETNPNLRFVFASTTGVHKIENVPAVKEWVEQVLLLVKENGDMFNAGDVQTMRRNIQSLSKDILSRYPIPEGIPPYLLSKLLVDTYLEECALSSYVSLRITYTYGPGMLSGGIVQKMIEAKLRGESMDVDSEGRRDFVYIEDLTEILERAKDKNVMPDSFIDVISGEEISLGNMLEILDQEFGALSRTDLDTPDKRTSGDSALRDHLRKQIRFLSESI